MFLGAVSSNGFVSPPIWFPVGFRLTSPDYIKVLKETLIPWMRVVSQGRHLVFQQDGAPAHTALATQDYLKRELGVHGFWSKDLWPPSSPDANPLDYSVWTEVERKACKVRHRNVAELKRDVDAAWMGLEKDYVVKTCAAFRGRLEKIVAAKGGKIDD